MKEIKNVIFDLGGVLVDLDIERCTAAFRELGMPRVADLINPYYCLLYTSDAADE